MTVLDYEHVPLMANMRRALREWLEPGQKLIFRSAFRWMRDMGEGAEPEVMCNHYESFSLEGLAEDFGYDIHFDFKHLAIVSKREVAA